MASDNGYYGCEIVHTNSQGIKRLYIHLGPFSLTKFNLNPNMDK